MRGLNLCYIRVMNKIATISKKVSGGEELVVVKRSDFEKLMRWHNEMSDALTKISRGRNEYKNKKTIVASSPRRFR